LVRDPYKTHKRNVVTMQNCWMLNLVVCEVTARLQKVKRPLNPHPNSLFSVISFGRTFSVKIFKIPGRSFEDGCGVAPWWLRSTAVTCRSGVILYVYIFYMQGVSFIKWNTDWLFNGTLSWGKLLIVSWYVSVFTNCHCFKVLTSYTRLPVLVAVTAFISMIGH
jgi:hypothetical protein